MGAIAVGQCHVGVRSSGLRVQDLAIGRRSCKLYTHQPFHLQAL